jgi:hypothetical protein
MEAKFDMPLIPSKKTNDKIPFKIKLLINESFITLFVECLDPEIQKLVTGPSEKGRQLAYKKIGDFSLGQYAGKKMNIRRTSLL